MENDHVGSADQGSTMGNEHNTRNPMLKLRKLGPNLSRGRLGAIFIFLLVDPQAADSFH